jgi:hypothetical protein
MGLVEHLQHEACNRGRGFAARHVTTSVPGLVVAFRITYSNSLKIIQILLLVFNICFVIDGLSRLGRLKMAS